MMQKTAAFCYSCQKTPGEANSFSFCRGFGLVPLESISTVFQIVPRENRSFAIEADISQQIIDKIVTKRFLRK